MTDDRAAIERCQAGDPEGFRALVECYEREAIAHALAFLRNREDALDAVQEAFVDAYQGIDRFDVKRRFYPWFYVILRNRCLKMLQRQKRQPKATSLDRVDLPFVELAGTNENMVSINDALMRLGANDREIILLKHVDGLTCEELARWLEIPTGTVMSRLYHARRRLRENLT